MRADNGAGVKCEAQDDFSKLSFPPICVGVAFSLLQHPQPVCSYQAELEASFTFLSAVRRKQASTRGLCKSGSLYGHMTPQESLRQQETYVEQ